MLRINIKHVWEIKKITMQTSIDHRNITTDLVVKLQTLGVSQTTLNTLKRRVLNRQD
jgi:hypothetical protein